MTLWTVMALADDALEIGKTYWVRDNTTGNLRYQFTEPLQRREAITVIERIRGETSLPGKDSYIIQRQSGERVEIWAYVLEHALKSGQIASEAPPPLPSRPKITYSPNEPEGYKDFKFGMTYEETREFYHPFGDLGRKQFPSLQKDILAAEKGLNLPFEDYIGPVHVKVYLGFLPDRPVTPESKLGHVLFSSKPDELR